jgi:hypothetical protein
VELALTPALGMTAAAAAATTLIRALERMGAAKLAPGMAHTLLQGQRRKWKRGLFSSCSLHRPFCCDLLIFFFTFPLMIFFFSYLFLDPISSSLFTRVIRRFFFPQSNELRFILATQTHFLCHFLRGRPSPPRS